MKRLLVTTALSGILTLSMFNGSGQAATITLTKLNGLTGGTIAQTAVFRGDVASVGLGSLGSVTIVDNSFGIGGAQGQFSGFDLDAVKISDTFCDNAACVASTDSILGFSELLFTPGEQRAPFDAKLLGTDATGNAVDNTVATLDVFDGESTTDIPGAFGFLSMGDGGRIDLTLASILSIESGPGPYIYFGEVGDNGEVAASSILLSPAPVPIPAALPLLVSGLAGLGFAAWRRRSNAHQGVDSLST